MVKEEENTLICFVKHYFPPSIKIKWTRNDVEVTSEDPFIKSLTNLDGTFYFIATLKFTPNEGDIYTCTVEYEMMNKTKFWGEIIAAVVNEYYCSYSVMTWWLLLSFPEVDGSMYTAKTTVGPTVYFGFATLLGLVGVAAGTFFFVKAQQPDPWWTMASRG